MIRHRRALAHFAAAQAQDQLALLVDAQTARAFKSHPDAARVRARLDDEVVFELLPVAVVDQIDAGVNGSY